MGIGNGGDGNDNDASNQDSWLYGKIIKPFMGSSRETWALPGRHDNKNTKPLGIDLNSSISGNMRRSGSNDSRSNGSRLRKQRQDHTYGEQQRDLIVAKVETQAAIDQRHNSDPVERNIFVKNLPVSSPTSEFLGLLAPSQVPAIAATSRPSWVPTLPTAIPTMNGNGSSSFELGQSPSNPSSNGTRKQLIYYSILFLVLVLLINVIRIVCVRKTEPWYCCWRSSNFSTHHDYDSSSSSGNDDDDDIHDSGNSVEDDKNDDDASGTNDPKSQDTTPATPSVATSATSDIKWKGVHNRQERERDKPPMFTFIPNTPRFSPPRTPKIRFSPSPKIRLSSSIPKLRTPPKRRKNRPDTDIEL